MWAICYRCHQPITGGSTRVETELGTIHVGTEVSGYSSQLGCPLEKDVLKNLELAVKQGFKIEFCRTHYQKH